MTYNGSPGGLARAKKLSAKRRREIASKAALARWGTAGPKDDKKPATGSKTQKKAGLEA